MSNLFDWKFGHISDCNNVRHNFVTRCSSVCRSILFHFCQCISVFLNLHFFVSSFVHFCGSQSVFLRLILCAFLSFLLLALSLLADTRSQLATAWVSGTNLQLYCLFFSFSWKLLLHHLPIICQVPINNFIVNHSQIFLFFLKTSITSFANYLSGIN